MAITNRFNGQIIDGDTQAELEASSTIYNHNVLIFALDTGIIKKGNNSQPYSDLPAIGGYKNNSGSLVFVQSNELHTINSINGSFQDVVDALTVAGLI